MTDILTETLVKAEAELSKCRVELAEARDALWDADMLRNAAFDADGNLDITHDLLLWGKRHAATLAKVKGQRLRGREQP